MSRSRLAALSGCLVSLVCVRGALASDPNSTIAQCEAVLSELLAIPGRQVPTRLINETQGIAIIPRVVKVGFVAGVRRGNGVVLVRDDEGQWCMPRFVTLTGGSVGWQAGVQSTDVVLVFRTRRSVERLMSGKFTIGVDAAAAAGPVGRNAAAATDATLGAEILSYSRSRGLFLGASVDGSVIELDQAANAAFYGSNVLEAPTVIPLAATRLQGTIAALAGGAALVANAPVAAAPVAGAPIADNNVAPAAYAAAVRTEALRSSLAAEGARLLPMLNPEWQAFLALPPATFDPAARPDMTAVAQSLNRYAQVAADAKFAELSRRPEFQSTLELLREYSAALESSAATLQLPPPPVDLRR